MTPLLELRDVSVVRERYSDRVVALRALSFRLERGELVCIEGANGAGKSTLLLTIAGELRLAAGEMLVHGASYRPNAVRRSSHAFLVPQSPVLGTAGLLTIREHLEVVAEYSNPSQAQRDRVERALNASGLRSAADRLAASLSGGQRQLLSLLLAIAQPAPIVMLDEPLAALDGEHAALAVGLVEELASAERGVLVVCHDRTPFEGIVTRSCVLAGGVMLGTQPADSTPVPGART